MLKAGRYLYVAFLCQQAIEKILKANYVKKYDETPPYTHNLVRLTSSLGIGDILGEDKLCLIELVNSYYIESRYTEEIDEMSQIMNAENAKEMFGKTKDLFSWLKKLI